MATGRACNMRGLKTTLGTAAAGGSQETDGDEEAAARKDENQERGTPGRQECASEVRVKSICFGS